MTKKWMLGVGLWIARERSRLAINHPIILAELAHDLRHGGAVLRPGDPLLRVAPLHAAAAAHGLMRTLGRHGQGGSRAARSSWEEVISGGGTSLHDLLMGGLCHGHVFTHCLLHLPVGETGLARPRREVRRWGWP